MVGGGSGNAYWCWDVLALAVRVVGPLYGEIDLRCVDLRQATLLVVGRKK